MTREENIKKILMALKNSVESIKGTSIVSKRGLVISKVFDFEINARMFGGITASIVGPTTHLAKTIFSAETFLISTIETKEGNTMIMDLKSSILVVITSPNPNVGLILFEMEKAGKEIMEAMK